MTAHCYAMVRGSVARFTLLDACGAPVVGSPSMIVTSGISKISINERTENRGTDLIRSGREDPRILFRGKTQTMGYTADLDLCGVDPDLLWLLTGQSRVTNYNGDVVGNDATTKLPVANFAMEVWSRLAQPVNGYTYGYTVFPRIRGGRVGGFSFGNGGLNLSITGARTVRMSKWGVGPYNLRGDSAAWDTMGWDTGPWDAVGGSSGSRCSTGALAPEEQGFGLDAFGMMPFGGGPFVGSPIHERLGQPIGSHTHWRQFLLDWAPSPMCGAQTLSDTIDNGTAAEPHPLDINTVDGQFVYTSADITDGGFA